MIFHPNPMIEVRSHYWEDQHFKRIIVKSVLVNNSKNPHRWIVYEKNRKGELIRISLQHITEEQAVVTAQTIANRIYRNKTKGHKSKKTPTFLTQLSRLSNDNQRLVKTLVSNLVKDSGSSAEVLNFLKDRYHLK